MTRVAALSISVRRSDTRGHSTRGSRHVGRFPDQIIRTAPLAPGPLSPLLRGLIRRRNPLPDSGMPPLIDIHLVYWRTPEPEPLTEFSVRCRMRGTPHF